VVDLKNEFNRLNPIDPQALGRGPIPGNNNHELPLLSASVSLSAGGWILFQRFFCMRQVAGGRPRCSKMFQDQWFLH
jgi:hypothetical protein